MAAHAALPTRFHSGETERERLKREAELAPFQIGELVIACPVCANFYAVDALECACGQLLDMAEPVAYEKPGETSAAICVACGDTGRNSRGGDCVPCVKRGAAA